MPGVTLGGLGALLKAAHASIGDIKNITVAGLGTIWSAVTFTPDGMNKSGAFSGSTGWTQVTGWAADTATYPGSVVTSNALIPQESGTNKTVTVLLPFVMSGPSSANVQLRIKQSGTVVATGSVTSVGAYATVNVTVTASNVNFNALEPFTVEHIRSGSGSPACSSGYCRIT